MDILKSRYFLERKTQLKVIEKLELKAMSSTRLWPH